MDPSARDERASAEDATAEVPELAIDVAPVTDAGEPPTALVTVRGELDVVSVPVVAARLRDLAASGTSIQLDLSGVSFASADLVRLLVEGPVSEVVAVSRAVDRVLALSGDIDLRPRRPRRTHKGH